MKHCRAGAGARTRQLSLRLPVRLRLLWATPARLTTHLRQLRVHIFKIVIYLLAKSDHKVG
jgi:hypothetical protein